MNTANTATVPALRPATLLPEARAAGADGDQGSPPAASAPPEDFEEFVFGHNLKTGSWHCTVCGTDMGPANPRQLCRKSYCDGIDWGALREPTGRHRRPES